MAEPGDEVANLQKQVADLRAELMEQFLSNHYEHCSQEWPHPEGYYCGWPLPEVLVRQ